MREPVAPFSTVRFGADQTLYLVVDHHGQRNVPDPEHEIERPDLENVLADLLGGRFQNPIRVVAFNTLEHWSKDISTDVAREIQCRCDSDGLGLPQYLAGFMEMHLRPTGNPISRIG